jgi:hypothetical protein
LCQTRCHAINVKTKKLLRKSAIVIEAGEGKEDRPMPNSAPDANRGPRDRTGENRGASQPSSPSGYLPDFLNSEGSPERVSEP